ncbi:uncharacterized protein PSFLO_00055 [Pseudozyma flocculosa]|uniref:Spc7 kinetochore protein domain-containing protein n=2 Tax=Pseudozyma flocculosa TaxID=84751 RepID=A0A5C3EQE0_9BASI|nr:uncharacterized protein PSFLO_00055 [Pseudozyma flocculosa]
MSLNGTGSGGLQLGGSSMTTTAKERTANTKENNKDDTIRSAREKLAKKKRAASVGGSELQTLLKETHNHLATNAATSRRNAPRPRKSAIRAVPQVFESPTGLVPSPKSRQGLALKPLVASPQNDRREPPNATATTTSAIGPAISQPATIDLPTAAATRDATQTIAAFGQRDPTLTLNDPAGARGCATQIIRPKRRVTFSKRQEKTEFAKDEPTLNLGSLRRDEPATPSTTQGSSSMGRSFNHSNSDSDSDSDPDSDDSDDASAMIMATTSDMMLTASSYGNASSDMDLSLDDPIDSRGLDGDDATKSMEITVAHGQIRKRKLSGMGTSDSDSDLDESLDAPGDVDLTVDDMSHAMDFTEAVGGAPLLKRRRSSVAQLAADRAVLMDNEQADDMTASRAGVTFTHAASDESSASFDAGDDQSAMMDFTMPMGLVRTGDDDTQRSVGGRSMATMISDRDSGDEDLDMSVSMDVTRPVTTVIKTKGAEAANDADLPQIGDDSVPLGRNNLGDDDSDDEPDRLAAVDASADVSMPMEMTHAMTGFIEQKDGDSSSDDDDGESMEMDQDATMQSTMQMTRAIGKITSQPSPAKHSPSLPPQDDRSRLLARTPSQSPRKPATATDNDSSSKMAGASPSKFRQSLRGGIESPSLARSPARRVGGTVPPPGRPSLSNVSISSFRQSLIGGVESPSYVRSPARRIQASPPKAAAAPATASISTRLATPTKPATSTLPLGLSLSARKRSPSPETKAAKRAAMTAGRKSLGSNLTTASSLYRPQPFGTSKDARAARSSIVAAVLPDHSRFKDESFASAPPSDMDEVSDLEVYGDELDNKAGESSYSFNDEGAPFHMPLNAFLSHVGVQFHEDMSASRRRPVPARDGDSSTDGEASGPKAPVSLVRLVKAACGAVPQLEALRDACREIKEQVEDGRDRLVEMEAAFYSNPPDFVREIMGLSNDEEKKEMEAQFKLQKQAARALAVSDYYGWRMDKEFDAEMVQTLQAYHGRLQCDLQIVEEKREVLGQKLLPPLRTRHLELQRELNAARRRQKEIEECDQDELKSLYASIEEQHEVLESMRAKLDETTQSHQRVLKRLHENEEKMASASDMIAKARAVCDQIQGCTRGEARRLLGEIRNLEKLHLVRIARVGVAPKEKKDEERSAIEVVMDGWLLVSLTLDLVNAGAVEAVSLQSVSEKGSAASEVDLIRQAAVGILRAEFQKEKPQNAVLILRRIFKTLIRHRHLQAEIEHLRCRFPLQLVATGGDASSTGDERHLSLRASVLLPRQRSKIVIQARSNLACIASDQPTFEPDQVRVETVYGPADALAMSTQILDCLAADPTIGSLGRACLETVETFDV